MTHIRFRLLRLIRTALESKSEFSFVADDFPLELRVLANMLPLWGRHKFKGKDTSRLQGPTKNSLRSSTEFAQVELVIQCLASEKDL